MKPVKNTTVNTRRSMVLRSDCTPAASDTESGHVHHHHHHSHAHSEHNHPVHVSVSNRQLSTSVVVKNTDNRGSAQKRTVLTRKETVSEQRANRHESVVVSKRIRSSDNNSVVDEKVLDYSLTAASPIVVVVARELADKRRDENGGVRSAKNVTSRSVTTSSSASKNTSVTNLKRSQLTSNHFGNANDNLHFVSPVENTVEYWRKQNGILSALKQSATNHSSASLSGDELEDFTKTDYTYANSASYCFETNSMMDIPIPNMSRPSIHSNSSGSSSYHASFASSAAGVNSSSTPKRHDSIQLNSTKLWSYVNAAKRDNAVMSSLSYGLDSDSDDDETHARRTHVETKTSRSLFSVLLSVGECILPVQTVWQKMWVFVYWILTSVLLWDSWIFARKYLRKFLLLLLLLLLPLCLWRTQRQDAIQFDSAALATRAGELASSFGTLPTFSFFASEAPARTTEKNVVQVDHLQMSNEKMDEIMLKMHSIQQGQLSRPDIEHIVRSVVKEEIRHLTEKMNGQEESIMRQAKSLSDVDEQLISLETQMKMMLAQELKSAKDNILSEHRSDNKHSIGRMQNLEKEMDSLKDNIQHIKETQDLLLETSRNCCRNHTYDPALVESQVAAVLLQIMGHPPRSGKSRSEYQSFAAWLKSSFVEQDKFSSTVHKINGDLDVISSRAELVAKSVAAAAVGAALEQQKQSIGLSVDGSATQLNEVEIRQIVRNALVMYDADKTGMADFALESAGGSIISTRCSETFHSRTALFTLFGIPLWYHSNSPRTVIQPGVHPGECWAFKGNEGYLVIQLSTWIQPTAFSLEHIPRSLAPNSNIDSAPREFSVFGLTNDKEIEGVPIGRYAYNVDGEPLQHFLVKDPDVGGFPIVLLHIRNNHGNLDYTCLYRFRVHGNPMRR